MGKVEKDKGIELNNPHRSLIKRMILGYYYSTTTSVLRIHDTNICDIIIYLLAT